MAYGENARNEARLSIQTLQAIHDWPVLVVSDEPFELPGVDFHYAPNDDPSFRQRKLDANILAPWDYTLYLDADTRVVQAIDAGFAILEDGWDMVIIPSANQGRDVLWHLNPEERLETVEGLKGAELQLQGGVFWFRKCEEIDVFFRQWREEWEQWQGQDQGALLRALHRMPINVWLLGRPFNGGAAIQHRFGKAASTTNTWRKPPRKRK